MSEAERKDQEESKQDQPIVFGMLMFLRCNLCVLESVVFAGNWTFELFVGSVYCNTQLSTYLLTLLTANFLNNSLS